MDQRGLVQIQRDNQYRNKEIKIILAFKKLRLVHVPTVKNKYKLGGGGGGRGYYIQKETLGDDLPILGDDILELRLPVPALHFETHVGEETAGAVVHLLVVLVVIVIVLYVVVHVDELHDLLSVQVIVKVLPTEEERGNYVRGNWENNALSCRLRMHCTFVIIECYRRLLEIICVGTVPIISQMLNLLH